METEIQRVGWSDFRLTFVSGGYTANRRRISAGIRRENITLNILRMSIFVEFRTTYSAFHPNNRVVFICIYVCVRKILMHASGTRV